jgi:ABC-type Zn uptake system ZnuABC Zn-binding protein ZnuA
MKYVARNEFGYYKFYRKIPNSQKQFIFSLKTKNAKLAKKIVSSFLIKSTQYFLYLQNLSKEDVMTRLEEIQKMLEAYREEALKEYSELERVEHQEWCKRLWRHTYHLL